MVHRLALILFTLLSLGNASEFHNASNTCLDDAVKEEERRFIRDKLDQVMVLGLLEGNWPSSGLLTEITLILLKEALGYHAKVHDVIGSFGASPIWALAGCLDFDAPLEKRCDEEETKVHISVDSWVQSYQEDFDKMKDDYPAIVPVDVGSMGYGGEESIYVTEANFQRAFNDVGLSLDFYRSYNTSHHDPKRYFDSMQDVPESELASCSETHMSNPQRMGFYLQFSGDTEGVVQQPNGDVVAKCFDDVWWISPACRQNHSGCIPTLTASIGWRLQAMMQWTTAYGIPAAIGIIGDFALYQQRVRKIHSLFYWWVPDSTFIDLQPMQLIFRRHSASAWDRGDKTTGGTGSLVTKVVSSNLATKASSVHTFVSNIQFELEQVQDMLLETTRASREEVACHWVRDNKDVWKRWIPVESDCFQGSGMVNSEGGFVESRDGAVGCDLCPAGRFSEETADALGKTYRCSLCPPGFSQSKIFATSCEACPKGTYSDTPGSESCSICKIGTYQDATMQRGCIPCGQYRTTRLPASISGEQCVCEQGRIEDLTGNDKSCLPCSKGLDCPRGSTRDVLLMSNNTEEETKLLLGFNSNPERPFDVFKCQPASVCQGGRPGNCRGTLRGDTCVNCGKGRFVAGDECLDCSAMVKLIWVFVGLAFCGLVIASYLMATSKYTHKATSLLCITSGVGMLVVLFQNLGVLHTISIPWPNGLNEFLRFASLFLLRLDGLGLSCFVWNSVVWEYALTTSVFWFLIFSLPALTLITKMIPFLVRRKLDWDFFKSFSTVGQFLQVGFTTMASLSMTPFMCFQHPNGQESILKYPGVKCGGRKHATMQVFGAGLIALSSTFLVFCTYAAIKAPTWSGSERLAAVRFLVVRFRPDVWWFGIVLLMRGLLLSVPAVVVTDMPSIHIALMLIVLLIALCLQTFFLPWKAPVLNLVDALSNGCFVALLSVSLAFLEVDSPEAEGILQAVALIFTISMVLILVFMILLSFIGLLYSSAMGNHRDSVLFNLGTVPDPRDIFGILQDIRQYLDEEGDGKEQELIESLGNFSVYDLDAIMRAMNILADDLEMVVNMDRHYSNRINSGQRSIRPTEIFLKRLSAGMRGSRVSAVSVRTSALRQSALQKRASRATAREANLRDSSVSGPWANPEYPAQNRKSSAPASDDCDREAPADSLEEPPLEPLQEAEEEKAKNPKARWQL